MERARHHLGKDSEIVPKQIQKVRITIRSLTISQYITNINKVLLVKEQVRTLRNGYKLDKFKFRKEIRKNWFTNKIVELNKLSKHVVSAKTADIFKERLVHRLLYTGLASHFELFTVEASSTIPVIYENHFLSNIGNNLIYELCLAMELVLP